MKQDRQKTRNFAIGPALHALGLGALLFALGDSSEVVAAGAPCEARYVAKAGETLAGIAHKCNVPLAELNRTNAYLAGRKGLRSGIIVTVPVLPNDLEPVAISAFDFYTPGMETVMAGTGLERHLAGSTWGTPSRQAGPHYLVEKGDTLADIAARYKTNVRAILLANPELTDPHRLEAGSYIRLPYRIEPASAAPRPRARAASGEDISVVALPEAHGIDLSVQLGDFPPNSKVRIGLGESASDYAVVSGGRTDNFGRLLTKFRIPSAFEGRSKLRVIAETLDETSSAISRPVNTAQPAPPRGLARQPARPIGQEISFDGVVTEEGKRCHAVRTEDGQLYTLTATDADIRPGDQVKVDGIVAPSDWCSLGSAIAVASVQVLPREIEAQASGQIGLSTDERSARKPSKKVADRVATPVRRNDGLKRQTPSDRRVSKKLAPGGLEVVSIDRPYSALNSQRYVRGIVVDREDRCTFVRGEDGELYAVEARLRAVGIGDRVELIGSGLARDPCGRGSAFRVEEARRYSKYGS